MQNTEITFCCRWSPTLGELESTHQKVWGTKAYGGDDGAMPTVFFGLYGLPDFFALWRHKGKKWILWCGTDIQHFLAGYWLDANGKIRIHATQLAPWIDTYCQSYVENDVEKAALASVGIRSKVVPSFLGDTNFEVSYSQSDKPKLYTSVSGDNYVLYGWDKIRELARKNPNIEFHLYGNTHPVNVLYKEDGSMEKLLDEQENIVDHGRVPKEQMNEEIKHMQGALRLAPFDGFSEILAKSVLMGQWPVSVIEYPHMLTPDRIFELVGKKKPNLEGRDYYRQKINLYPWNKNILK